MTTEPNTGSIASVTEMLMETPQQAENPSEVVEAPAETTEDAQIDVEDYIAESEDDTSYDSDDAADEADYETVDEDEYTDEPAVPVEVSDDVELEVKSDGQTRKENQQELKSGYAGKDDVKKGRERQAPARKELGQMKQARQQEREHVWRRLSRTKKWSMTQAPRKPAKELQDSDPLGYLEQMEQYREQSAQYETFQREAQQMKQQKEAQDAQAQQVYVEQQAEALKQEIPELRDPEKSKKLLSDIHSTATGYYGVPEEIVGALSHGWEFKIMRDAVAYRKLMASKGKVEEKSKSARPMVKPGAKRTEDGKAKQRQQARSRMKKTGDVSSVAKFLLS